MPSLYNKNLKWCPKIGKPCLRVLSCRAKRDCVCLKMESRTESLQQQSLKAVIKKAASHIWLTVNEVLFYGLSISTVRFYLENQVTQAHKQG